MTVTQKKINELVAKLPNPVFEKQILAQLEGLTEAEIMELAKSLIDLYEGRKRVDFLRVIVKKINKHSNLIYLLEIGYRKKLVSEIGYWITFVLPKIELKKFVASWQSQSLDVQEMIRYHVNFIENEQLREKIIRMFCTPPEK